MCQIILFILVHMTITRSADSKWSVSSASFLFFSCFFIENSALNLHLFLGNFADICPCLRGSLNKAGYDNHNSILQVHVNCSMQKSPEKERREGGTAVNFESLSLLSGCLPDRIWVPDKWPKTNGYAVLIKFISIFRDKLKDKSINERHFCILSYSCQ